MDLKEIMSISGHSGLFKYVSKGHNGIIVEGLDDKKRMNAFSSMKVIALQDIAIFTEDKDIPLVDVFKKIFDKESGALAIDHKSDEKTVIQYFSTVLPEYDKERVHLSDMKKVISWYNILHRHGLLEFTDTPPEVPTDTEAPKE